MQQHVRALCVCASVWATIGINLFEKTIIDKKTILLSMSDLQKLDGRTYRTTGDEPKGVGIMIVGWGRESKQLAYLGIRKCPNCKNYSNHHMYLTQRKVTAYFIPVAKFNKKYFYACAICQAGYEIEESSKDDFLSYSARIPNEFDFNRIWDAIEAEFRTYLLVDVEKLLREENFSFDGPIANAFNRTKSYCTEMQFQLVLEVFLEAFGDKDTSE
jgi:hypothetical protein